MHRYFDYFLKKYRNKLYTMVTTTPKIERITPASAVLVFSVRKLNKPVTIPITLAAPPHTGIIARHRLINPSAAEASARNFAVRSSGSRLFGSTSMLAPLKERLELYSGKYPLIVVAGRIS